MNITVLIIVAVTCVINVYITLRARRMRQQAEAMISEARARHRSTVEMMREMGLARKVMTSNVASAAWWLDLIEREKPAYTTTTMIVDALYKHVHANDAAKASAIPEGAAKALATIAGMKILEQPTARDARLCGNCGSMVLDKAPCGLCGKKL